jgi:hypothetical protein
MYVLRSSMYRTLSDVLNHFMVLKSEERAVLEWQVIDKIKSHLRRFLLRFRSQVVGTSKALKISLHAGKNCLYGKTFRTWY